MAKRNEGPYRFSLWTAMPILSGEGRERQLAWTVDGPCMNYQLMGTIPKHSVKMGEEDARHLAHLLNLAHAEGRAQAMRDVRRLIGVKE